MSIKSRVHTSYTYEDKQDNCFPIPWEFSDGSELLFISPDGLTAVLGSLTQESDAQDPFEMSDEGEFIQFNNSYIHSGSRPNIEDFKRMIRSNPGRVFTISMVSDGYAIDEGPFSAKDTRNIYKGESVAENKLDNADGYYICPEDASNPAQYAKGALKSYSQWANGEVYGVCIWIYTRNSTDDQWEDPDRDNECWGYIGSEYAESELQSQFQYEVGKLPGIVDTWFSGQWFKALYSHRGGQLEVIKS